MYNVKLNFYYFFLYKFLKNIFIGLCVIKNFMLICSVIKKRIIMETAVVNSPLNPMQIHFMNEMTQEKLNELFLHSHYRTAY